MVIKKKDITGKINRALDLPVNLVSGLSQIHITGDKEILFEGHKGILQYDDDVIKIAAKDIAVSFFGQDLTLRSLNNESIIIQGKIQNIEFEKV